jgi:hypothetical protein
LEWKVAVVDETATFWFADAGTFRVRAREQTIDVDELASERRMVRYLLVTGLSAALSAMGRLVLHGGTVVGPGGAVAVCGPSGRGKSTTVVSLFAAGFGVLHDDLTVLSDDWTAYPGPRQARIDPGTAACLGLKSPADAEGEVPVPLPGASPSPLRAVLMLGPRGREPALRRLHQRQAAVRLGQEAGLWVLLTKEARRARFELLARLAADIPCYAWSAPHGVDRAVTAAADVVNEVAAIPGT